MRRTKDYPQRKRRYYRPEVTHCPFCQTKLQRAMTLAQRTIVTLDEVVYVDHRGYRCPNEQCERPQQVYRSAEADALALPNFTFGLDVVVWVGTQKLVHHQTVDEVHEALQNRLKPLGVSCSRRNILYLFEAYAALLKAAGQPRDDPRFQMWLDGVRTNGGMILSIDGIQPDKGQETIYLVREVLTGRLLTAVNVSNSEAEVIKEILRPLKHLGVPILGVVSDAQRSLRDAIADVFPQVPHQTCHFHYLQDAARPIFEVDRGMRAQMRKAMTEKLRPFRPQVQRRMLALSSQTTPEAKRDREQLAVLRDYAACAQASLHLDGSLPFDYPGLKGYQALDALATSLEHLGKKGGQETPE